MLKVLIADDHRIFRQGVRMVLELETDIEIVGEARYASEALQMATALEPDVILMDLDIPDADGVEVAKQIVKERPDTAVILLTISRQDDRVLRAILAGVKGCLFKGVSGLDLVDAIHKVAAGGAVLDATMTSQLFDQLKLMYQLQTGKSSRRNKREGPAEPQFQPAYQPLAHKEPQIVAAPPPRMAGGSNSNHWDD